jgi:hypothetical protein
MKSLSYAIPYDGLPINPVQIFIPGCPPFHGNDEFKGTEGVSLTMKTLFIRLIRGKG